MAEDSDVVLQMYIQKFGRVPKESEALVTFSKSNALVPNIERSDADKALGKIKTAIKSKPKPKKKKSAKWRVGDEVLISKDRIGILKYIGPCPEMGDDDVYYGLELSQGTLGQNDGMIKGKRYFQTDEKRGMFIPEHKLRRRLNRKDKQRKNSYQMMSSQVKQLQRDYASSTGGDSVSRELSATPNQDPEQAEQYGNSSGQYQSTTMDGPHLPPYRSAPNLPHDRRYSQQSQHSAHSQVSQQSGHSQQSMHSMHSTPLSSTHSLGSIQPNQVRTMNQMQPHPQSQYQQYLQQQTQPEQAQHGLSLNQNSVSAASPGLRSRKSARIVDELEDVDDRVLNVPTKRKRKGSTQSNGSKRGDSGGRRSKSRNGGGHRSGVGGGSNGNGNGNGGNGMSHRDRSASAATIGSGVSSGRYSINPNTQYTDSEEIDDAALSGSDASDLDERSPSTQRNGCNGPPTVKTFDTLLKYILRQKRQYREALLDVYANPQLQPLMTEAFGEMKQLSNEEQEFLWPALLKRWSKYTR